MTPTSPAGESAAPPLPPQAVFLSYAREDSAAAQRIAEALRDHGVEVWFDQNELRGGDAWDAKIRRQIKECALFLPVISAHTQNRPEGYFRLEWKLAVDRLHLMVAGAAFLVPVAIDAAPAAAGMVPEEFLRVHWTRLPKGLPTPQFVEQVERLLRSPRKTGATIKFTPGAVMPASVARPTPKFPAGAGIAAGLLILGVAAFFWFRPAAAPVAIGPAAIAAAPKSASAPPASLPTDKSIAVLPFENMSADTANAYFCDGVQEDILTHLANISELRVVSRTSVEQYRATTKSIRQIAQELNVTWVLEGSVQRAGAKVRVTGQLINAASDEHVWAKAYDRDLSDIFAIQSELAETIADSLQAKISPQEKTLVEHRPTENLAAYDLYLKGRQEQLRNARGTRTWLKEAEDDFQRAVDLDRNFALAWGQLAVTHAYYVFWNFDHTPARLARADAAIGRAITLAPDSPEIMELQGDYAYHGYRDYARATAQFEKVIQLQPNNADAIFSLGLVQRRQGRWLESLGNLRKGLELDPGNAKYAGNLSASLVAGRRWTEARTMQQRVVTLLPDNIQEQAILAYLDFAATGSTQRMNDWLAQMNPAERDSPRVRSIRKWWAATEGNYAEWKDLDRIQPFFDEDDLPHWSQAIDAAVELAAHGDRAEAEARLGAFPAEVRSARQLDPANGDLWSALSRAEAILGQKDEALHDARQAVTLLPESQDAGSGAIVSANLASIYAWTGESDQAFAELTRLMQLPCSTPFQWPQSVNVHSLASESAFAPLKRDARFQALLADPKNNVPLF